VILGAEQVEQDGIPASPVLVLVAPGVLSELANWNLVAAVGKNTKSATGSKSAIHGFIAPV